MSKIICPENYHALLDRKQTEQGIKLIKDFFQQNLSTELRLSRVTAPLFVMKGLGINDDLNGVERAVSFPIKDLGDAQAEVVHSLAKWKRLTLAEYQIEPGYGIYTDMNAIRADEELDNLHSLYVDQWDWEKVIKQVERFAEYLEDAVDRIYIDLKNIGDSVNRHHLELINVLQYEITYITSQELEDMYPDLNPEERENEIAKKERAVFISKIGGNLKSGKPHDGRAPDYDDWELNGDIILWNDILESAYEISSMGIRVDEESMKKQLEISGKKDRENLDFHKKILNRELPYTVGGGIGQSRLCMYFLRKAHIGEVQVSVWPNEMIKKCEESDIFLL